MGEKVNLVDSLSELQKSKVADVILPGIRTFLEDILAKENLSEDAESIRAGYVSLLNCPNQESRENLRKRVRDLNQSPVVKHEAPCKTSKLGQVEEKRLISIRQFQINQNQGKQGQKNKMESESTAGYTSDEDCQIAGNENFVEFTKSEEDLSTKKLAKSGGDTVNSGYLFHKETDGLRRRWCVLDGQVLKCYKRQNQHLAFEVNFCEWSFSAIQGRVGKMFAIRLSCAKGPTSHLFASPKAEVCASWMMKFSSAGVQLQDDILREVSLNQQKNNKTTWDLGRANFLEKDAFRSDLLEALEYIERSKSAHILPKRSSYSFKELDVLKKLKTSLVSKKAESKLNRRKTWSAGSFPNHIAVVEGFRKPGSLSNGCGLPSGKDDQNEAEMNQPDKSLPEILTSSGVVKIEKQDISELGKSVENVDRLLPSEDEMSFAMSLPEGLNKQHLADTTSSSSPRGSTVAKSVPDLLILPGQESPDLSSDKQEKSAKPAMSLTRVMSVKASQVKNAIITGFKRKGRRSGGRVFLDRDHATIHGCLYRKRGILWKKRWCIVTKETFYAFRDSSLENEDFSCSLRKCIALRICDEPGRAYSFKLVRRKGEEVMLAAEDSNELERWMDVLQRETSKQNCTPGGGSRSSSLTGTSLYSEGTFADSSAAEDTNTDCDVMESYNGETTDKDSSDEHSTSSVPLKLTSRGINEEGFVYYLVGKEAWEHCWMEVTLGVLSIYSSESKDTPLQRDHVPLCDIQENTAHGQRSHSFVLKRPGRKPIYLEVDTETDFLKWVKCFKSWKSRDTNVSTRSNVDTTGYSGTDRTTEGVTTYTTDGSADEVATSDDNLLTVPRSFPIGGTPATSDSDCYAETAESNKNDRERPKIRRSMTSVLSQLTPKVSKRRNTSNAPMIPIDEVEKNVSKSSCLYFKANTGLWVKQWCVLQCSVLLCFNSPQEAEACFTVDATGCEVRRTSCQSKNFTFEVFNRALDKHFEFAGESAYVMYAWMRVLKIASGLGPEKENNSNEGTPLGQPSSNAVLPGGQPELSDERTVTELKKSGETAVDASADQQKGASQRTMDSHTAPQQNGSAISRVPLSVQHSPRRKTRITSLDEVLKLLHEKQLEQQLQNKEMSSSSRARMKWQHSMLVALRKSRLTSNSETSKSSASVVNERENVAPELDEKTARIKYREISEKYDHVIEDEKQKMLRRETLLKKRRNSLILRQDILEKKLAKSRESSKTQLKKKLSKDNKDIPLSLTKGDGEELTKQLAEISKELEGIKQNMDTNLKEHQKISDDLNEKKRKELHELRITVDMSPHSSKSNLNEHGSKLHRRQMSDTSLITMSRTSEDFRKMSVRAEAEKPRLTQSLSSPSEDLRPKAKSFSSQRLPKVPSSPLLRAKTYDSTRPLVRPSVKSRTSQEALSVALSQIEDFEAFAQGSCRNNNGADVGC